MRKEVRDRQGFTLVELIAATVMAAIVVLGIGIVLADSQKGWRKMYDRVYSDVVTDAYVARRAFDRAVRKSTIRYPPEGNYGTTITVYYYDDPETSLLLDKYAKFYQSGDVLLVDYGDLQPGTWNPQGAATTITLARSVESANFVVEGLAVRMTLTLDNEKERMTLTSSAVRHNDWF
jgi:type II secretory pathway pseudopilin PulG